MTTARQVPQTRDMRGDELDAEDAWAAIRRHGTWPLLRAAFVRFRFGDGFSQSRALGLQLCLALVPMLIALTGLAADLDADREARVVAETIKAITPGQGAEDQVVDQALEEGAETGGEIALVLGLAFSMVSMVTAIAQVERGTNRIYGIRRDRPALRKYGRAALLAAVLVLPTGLGFLLLVGGSQVPEILADAYALPGWFVTAWAVLRWPIGLAVTTVTVAVLLDHAPRRRQPGLSWLALGSGLGVVLTTLASAGLAVYVSASGSFGEMYGPLAGIMALLLWSFLSSIAIFYGAAVAAQLEAMHAGVTDPVEPDPDRQVQSSATLGHDAAGAASSS